MRCPGFTMLEMLLATALAAILMVGVLGLIADIGSAQLAADESETPIHSPTSTRDAWVVLLRGDLEHAREVDLSQPNVLRLVGVHALDSARRETTHRPVEVNYRLEDINGRLVLVREQAVLDVATNQNVQRDLVCDGVSRFELALRIAEADRHGAESGAAALPGRDTRSGAGAASEEPVAAATEENSDTEAGTTTGPGPGPDIFRRFSSNSVHRWTTRSKQRGDASAGSGSGAGLASGNRGPSLTSINSERRSRSEDSADKAEPKALRAVWRLRAWADSADEPSIDRVVLIQSVMIR